MVASCISILWRLFSEIIHSYILKRLVLANENSLLNLVLRIACLLKSTLLEFPLVDGWLVLVDLIAWSRHAQPRRWVIRTIIYSSYSFNPFAWSQILIDTLLSEGNGALRAITLVNYTFRGRLTLLVWVFRFIQACHILLAQINYQWMDKYMDYVPLNTTELWRINLLTAIPTTSYFSLS